MNALIPALLLAGVLLPWSARAAVRFTAGAGLEYTRGDYGADVTSSQWLVPLQSTLSGERWAIGARLPFVSAEGTINRDVGSTGAMTGTGMGGGMGGSGAGAPRTSAVTQSGLGDATLDLTYTAWVIPGRFEADIGAAVKAVTADRDDDLITTGSEDYQVHADLYADAGGLDFAGSLAWTRKGDINVRDDTGTWSTLDVDDPFALTGSVALAVTEATRAGLQAYWREALVADGDAAAEWTGFVTHRAGNYRLRFYLLVGLSDASPDVGAGLAIVRRPARAGLNSHPQTTVGIPP